MGPAASGGGKLSFPYKRTLPGMKGALHSSYVCFSSFMTGNTRGRLWRGGVSRPLALPRHRVRTLLEPPALPYSQLCSGLPGARCTILAEILADLAYPLRLLFS